MFVVLEPQPRAKGFSMRARGFLRPAVPKLVQVKLPSAAAFYRLPLPFARRGIDWRRVRGAAGGLAERLLLPPEVVLPEGCGCAVWQGTRLAETQCFHTALALLRVCAFDPRGLCVTLVDRDARFTHELRLLMPLAAELRVVTERPERYAPVREAMLAEYGAALLLSESLSAAQGGRFVIAPQADSLADTALDTIAVTNGATNARFAVRGQGCTLPPEYAALCPPKIPPESFAAALYECCHAAVLGAQPFRETTLNGAAQPLPAIARELRHAYAEP